MKTVIVLSGKASLVFKQMALIAKYKGNETIAEIAKEQEGNKC